MRADASLPRLHLLSPLRQSLFVGLAFNSTPAKSGEDGLDDLHWFIAVSDGFAIQNSEHGRVESVDLRPGSDGPRKTIGRIVDRLRQYAASQSYKVRLSRCLQVAQALLLAIASGEMPGRAVRAAGRGGAGERLGLGHTPPRDLLPPLWLGLTSLAMTLCWPPFVDPARRHL
jgi:hypothetical protein